MGGTDITNDGCIGPKSTAFYELRGKGGAAAVTVSECMVHPETDGSHAYHLDTAILNSLASATYIAEAISRHGAVPSLELSHSGMYAGTYMTDKSRQHAMHQWGASDCVRPDGVLCETEARKQILVPGTSVICALGQRARSEVADALRDSAPFVRIIGDARRVSTITNAVYEGYHAALDI